MSYVYHTRPFAHQRREFERSRDAKAWALFMEQGTGKTKILLDTAAYLWEARRIQGLVVVADNGVHSNWTSEEIPEHFPPRIPRLMMTWDAGRVKTKRWQESFTALLDFAGLAILAVNVEAIRTKPAKLALLAFLRARRSLFIVDESSSIKTPSAERTKAAMWLARFAPIRRIANGTPVTESPFDVYAQCNFLGRGLHGHTSFLSFKHEFADLIPMESDSGKTFYVVEAGEDGMPKYKNLDVLRERLDKFASFVTKDECLDLPPKLFKKRVFTLAKEQRRIYDKLRDEYLLELSKLEEVPLPLMITRMLRLQQIASGFFPSDPDAPDLKYVPGCATENPRAEALDKVLDGISTKRSVIIWARFRADTKMLYTRLCERYGEHAVVLHDGSVPEKERLINRKRFQDRKARFFIGTPRTGARGVTLTAASFVIFYSNDFSLERRLQAEDRAHRIGQTNRVTYIDLVAENTVDDKRIIPILRGKRGMSNLIMRQELKDWI